MDQTNQGATPAQIVTNPDGSKTIPLRKPLDVSGAKVKALTMREPLVEDQLAMDAAGGTDAQRELFMMAMLCGVAPTDLHKMPTREYKLLVGAYLAFHE